MGLIENSFVADWPISKGYTILKIYLWFIQNKSSHSFGLIVDGQAIFRTVKKPENLLAFHEAVIRI